jgi:hypothetical protein
MGSRDACWLSCIRMNQELGVGLPGDEGDSFFVRRFETLVRCIETWRRGRDLNSRMSYPISGFQDQPEPFSLDLTSSQKDEETRSRGES